MIIAVVCGREAGSPFTTHCRRYWLLCLRNTLFLLFDFVAPAVQFVPDRRGNFPEGQHSSRVHVIVCSNPTLPCAGTAFHPAMVAAEMYLGKTRCGEVNGLAQRFLLALDRIITRASLA